MPQKKAVTERRRVPAALLILLIMLLAFAFRFVVKGRGNALLGESGMDPETGLPYLTEIDSYYHLRMTRDIEEKGHPGEILREGEPWDTLSYAPAGRSAKDYRPLLATVTAGVHRLLGLFLPVSLEQVAYWMGPLLSVLVVIPVFLFVRRLKGTLAAVTASVLSVMNYGYFLHTVPGFFDTDCVILSTSCGMFLCGCLLVNRLQEWTGNGSGHGRARLAGTAALFALMLLLLHLAWSVSALFIGIFLAALLVMVLLRVLTAPKEGRREAIGREKGMLVLTVILGIGMIALQPELPGMVAGLFRELFMNRGPSLFPNAYVSVSELRRPALVAGGLTGFFQMRVLTESNIGVINAVGSIVPVLGAAAMSVILVMQMRRRKEIPFESVLLLVWFLVTSVLAFRSWRFIMLLAVPVAILAGMLTGTLHALMRDHRMMDYPVFSGMITTLMLFPALFGAYRSSADSLPQVNRDLHNSVMQIRDLPEETVIASWWDYGYFFEEKAGRRTLFDGGSQNSQRIFWVARALASGNETLSRNILCMLAGSGDAATEAFLNRFGETRETLEWMGILLAGDADSARLALQEAGLNRMEADELTNLLFPQESVPLVTLLSRDMSRIANWFGRFGYPEEEQYNGNGYSVLVDGLEYRGSGQGGWRFMVSGTAVDLTLKEENGRVTASTRLAGVPGLTQPFPVERVLVLKDGKIADNRIKPVETNTPVKYTFILNLDRPVPAGALMTSLMADSVFGRLMYLDGTGLACFTPIEGTQSSAKLYRTE